VLTTGSALTFDGTNLGLGVTPSAWAVAYAALQFKNSTSISSYSSNDGLNLCSNAYASGSNSWKYLEASSYPSARYEIGNGSHNWYNAASGTAGNTIAFTQAMTLDASGNLGLGSTSPTGISGYTALKINNATNGAIIDLAQADTMRGRLVATTSSFVLETSGSIPIVFSTGGSEDVRIDSSGNLLVGMTSVFAAQNGCLLQPNGSTGVNHVSGTSSGVYFSGFYYNNAAIGSITQSGTTAVAYNTISDYRLKENVQSLSGALARVSALKPCTYTWKAAPDEIGEGFIAHELAEVCPQAVTGEKDAVDEKGNAKYQSIDTSFLVATLTAAIQEQQAIITSLTARIEALEA
jgi:hypothetical protein